QLQPPARRSHPTSVRSHATSRQETWRLHSPGLDHSQRDRATVGRFIQGQGLTPMDRTNAERQRRYVARLKAKAEVADDAAEALKNSTCSKCGKKTPNPITIEAGLLKILLCQKCGMKLLSQHVTRQTALEWKTDTALKKRACMIGYQPKKHGDWPRGWY